MFELTQVPFFDTVVDKVAVGMVAGAEVLFDRQQSWRGVGRYEM